MSKIIPVFAIACLGAAAASVLAVYRAQQRAAKVLDKEDIQRWEAEGGNVPLKPSSSTAQATTTH